MESDLVVKISDNIISPLGYTTDDTFSSVLEGRVGLRLYEGLWGIPEPFIASLLDRKAIRDMFQSIAENAEDYSLFEQMCILSAYNAIRSQNVDASSDRTMFFLSTTKGNVSLLDGRNEYVRQVLLGYSANKIAGFFGNPNPAIAVSNACTSGVCVQIAAMRALKSGRCDTAVVIGADEQSKFIISGFQSFKALSDDFCRPFDLKRKGLNLGEAAATVIYTKKQPEDVVPSDWVLCDGAIRNDANHISGPSRTAEGCLRAINAVKDSADIDDIAFISAHGTATMYNDEMESIAVDRAGLSGVPVNALKGYFGHTMGAAGVLESILGMKSIDNHMIIGTKGYSETGVSRSLILDSRHSKTDKRSFIKMLSGFGGCNAVALFKQGGGLC